MVSIKKEIIISAIFFIISIVLAIHVAITSKTVSHVENVEKITTTQQITTTTEEPSKKVTITAVGDCALGWDTNFSYTNRFDYVMNKNNNDYSYVFKNVLPIFENDDLTIINLEGTLTNSNDRVTKKFNFKAPPEYANIIKQGNVEVVSFANNHAHDYGESGYKETINTLTEYDISNYGYNRYLIKEVNGIKIGFFALLDIYGERYTEVNKAIKFLKSKNCDLIIASMHWGIEKDYDYHDFQTKMGHYLIDNGVDLVIGTHPHVIQGIEKYKDKYIVYSLANFAFGGNINPNDFDTFIFQQTFEIKDDTYNNDDIKIIPTSISSVKSINNYQPTPLSGTEKTRVLNKILDKSKGFEYNK